MKKNVVLFFALFICSAVFASSEKDLKQKQKDLIKAQQEVESLTSKKSDLEKKYKELQVNLDEAKEKVEELQDKPKSLTYKNALKKLEKLQDKIGQTEASIEQLNNEIDATNQKVIECESILKASQEFYDAEHLKTNEVIAQEENVVQTDEIVKTDDNYVNSKQKESLKSEKDSSKKEGSKEEAKGTSSHIVVWIILCVLAIVGWYDFRRKHHCNKCGKWFTIKSIGDVSIREHDHSGKISRRGARKRYRCSHCGAEKEFIEWFSK